MSNRTTPPTYDGDTQSEILEVATRLFALKGFKGVTLKEIAKAVGIKIGSLYYYYDSKGALIEDVLMRFDRAHQRYSEWLAKANDKVESIDDVMNNLFNHNFLVGLDTIGRLGMSMALREQHNSDLAYQLVHQNYYNEAIESIKTGFDRLIEKNVVPPSDTRTLATLFMMCVMSANDVHIHKSNDMELPIDSMDVYSGLKAVLTSALEHGVIQAAEKN